MEFFDKIGKKASEAYKVTADKTGKIAKETKMKLKINELKSEINDMYKEIGRKVYEKHVIEDEISIKKDLETECTKIEELLEQCLSLKDKKQCQNCYKEIDIESNYCPNCGEKQKTQEVEKETENKEKTNDVNEKENNENINNDNNENDDSDKNTEVQESEQENIENSETTNLEKTVSVESDIDIEENLEDEE